MLAMVPVNTIEGSVVPSPVLKKRPFVPLSVSVPLVAVRVTCTVAFPASGSEIEIAFPFPVENTIATLRVVAWAPGTELTGGSLTAVTVTVFVTAVLVPPSPSVSTKRTVRLVSDGVSETLRKVMFRTSACVAVGVALAFRVTTRGVDAVGAPGEGSDQWSRPR